MAIAKCMEYKGIVTGRRVKKYTRVARLSVVIMVVPFVIAAAFNLPYEIILVECYFEHFLVCLLITYSIYLR